MLKVFGKEGRMEEERTAEDLCKGGEERTTHNGFLGIRRQEKGRPYLLLLVFFVGLDVLKVSGREEGKD